MKIIMAVIPNDPWLSAILFFFSEYDREGTLKEKFGNHMICTTITIWNNPLGNDWMVFKGGSASEEASN